jgi:lipopolysaccharide biosynthesis glycosyltransferase
MKKIKIFMGYDRGNRIPAHGLMESILENTSIPVEFEFLHKGSLSSIFTREMGPHDSTEFSNSRFLVPYLSNYEGFSVFIDNDMVVTGDVAELLNYIDEDKTVMCVKHNHIVGTGKKFLDMPQSGYSFKNWTSVMIFNNAKCKALTPEYVNTAPGLDMHQFKWIENFNPETDVGEIPLTWNYLCDSEFEGKDQVKGIPKLIHYTEGGPYFEATKDCEYAEEWLRVYNQMNDFRNQNVSLRK